MVKIGLIGCGAIAQRSHLPNLMRLAGVEVAAFADPDATRRSIATQLAPHARAFRDYRALFDETQVDAVLVCVPNCLHSETTIAAVNAGAHVYLEKPLATNLDEAGAVVEAWRRTSLVGMMGFNYRFNQLYCAVRDQIAKGTLGKLLTVRTVFSTNGKDLPAWKLSRRTGGGALPDLASHHFDLIRYFFKQEVAEVLATIESRRTEQDTAWLQMRLDDGLMIQSFFSTAGVEEDRFEIYGEDGKLNVDRYRSLAVRVTNSTLKGFRIDHLKQFWRTLRSVPYTVSKFRAAAHEPSYRTALENFVAAVESNANRSPDFNDGYQNFLIIDAAERSARTGSKIHLDARPGRTMCA